MKRLWQAIKTRWDGLLHGRTKYVPVSVRYIAPNYWTCPGCGDEWYPDDVGWEGLMPGTVGTMRCYCGCAFDVEMIEVGYGY